MGKPGAGLAGWTLLLVTWATGARSSTIGPLIIAGDPPSTRSAEDLCMSGCLAAESSDEGQELVGSVDSSKMMVMEVPRVRYRQAVASAQAHSRERDYEQASNHSPRSRSRLTACLSSQATVWDYKRSRIVVGKAFVHCIESGSLLGSVLETANQKSGDPRSSSTPDGYTARQTTTQGTRPGLS